MFLNLNTECNFEEVYLHSQISLHYLLLAERKENIFTKFVNTRAASVAI